MIRAAALTLDLLLFGIISGLLLSFCDTFISDITWKRVIVVVWTACYFVGSEASALQGTPGKKFLRLKVTDLHGRRVSLWRACMRNLAKCVSCATLGIGGLMCAWTRQKQCLHDIMSGCLVLRDSSDRLVNPYRWVYIRKFSFVPFLLAAVLLIFGILKVFTLRETPRAKQIIPVMKEAAQAQQRYWSQNNAYAKNWIELKMPALPSREGAYCMLGPQSKNSWQSFGFCGSKKKIFTLRLGEDAVAAERANSKKFQYVLVLPYQSQEEIRCIGLFGPGQSFCNSFSQK